MAVHKKDWVELHPQFLIDGQGRKTAAVIDIEAYQAILEQLEYESDLQALKDAIAANPTFRDWEDVEADLREEGLL
jgi:hypothetical protein